MNFNLKTKSNESLLADLKEMVANERQLQTQILHYLLEVEERKLYLPAYQTLFDFVTKELGYSEPAANRRIQAMRLMRAVPEVEEKLETGRLSLSVAAQVQSFIRQENKKRKEANKEFISSTEKLELVEAMEGTSVRECEKKLIAMAPEAALPGEKTKPLTEDKTLIQFVADNRLMKKIEKLDPEQREVRRGKRREKNLSEVTSASEWNLHAPAPTTAPESDSPVPHSQPKNRCIPQPIRDQVWVRDHGECQYKHPLTGRVCGSKHGVQLDHIKPYAAGGEHTQENLRLLCGAHNRYRNFRELFY